MPAEFQDLRLLQSAKRCTSVSHVVIQRKRERTIKITSKQDGRRMGNVWAMPHSLRACVMPCWRSILVLVQMGKPRDEANDMHLIDHSNCMLATSSLDRGPYPLTASLQYTNVILYDSKRSSMHQQQQCMQLCTRAAHELRLQSALSTMCT